MCSNFKIPRVSPRRRVLEQLQVTCIFVSHGSRHIQSKLGLWYAEWYIECQDPYSFSKHSNHYSKLRASTSSYTYIHTHAYTFKCVFSYTREWTQVTFKVQALRFTYIHIHLRIFTYVFKYTPFQVTYSLFTCIRFPYTYIYIHIFIYTFKRAHFWVTCSQVA